MASAQSSNFVRIDENIAVDGGINETNVLFLAENFKSVLYLCVDSESDCGVTGGFATIQKHFPGDSSLHIVMNPQSFCFKPDEQNLVNIMKSYRSYELALNRLPKPVAIVCKTNRRASTVAMTYRGVHSGQDAFSVIRESTERGFKFVEMAGLTNWVTMVLNTSANAHVSSPLIFRQLFESETSTYTYLLADPVTKEALLIDPVLETAERDAKLIRELDLTLKYGLNTHVHADHITGTGKLKTIFPDCQSCIAAVSGATSDVKLEEFDMVSIGNRHVFCYSTPGHTNGCITYVLDDGSMAFTGDTLLIRGCGRTDFQSGSSETLYDSIHQKIFTLNPNTKIYPGHDYKGMTSSTVAEEMAHNPRLTKSKDEFKDIMANLNLAYPKKIDASVPANMRCGF